MKPHLVLGTAQFGLNYGITNKEGKVSIEEASSILRLADKNSIYRLDTAQVYGDAEEVIGKTKINLDNFLISSKLKPILNDNSNFEQVWEKSVHQSLSNLGVNSLDCLMIHRASDLLSENKDILIKWLLKIKEKGLIRKIGVSIYHDENVKKLPLDSIDLIQLPLSFYDQRAIKSGLISFLRSKDIEIQARSIFLQGLILSSPDRLPNWISSKDRSTHSLIYSEILNRNSTALDYSLSFFKNKNDIGSITFGVQNKFQFNEIVKSWNSSHKFTNDFFKMEFSSEFLDPRQWPKN